MSENDGFSLFGQGSLLSQMISSFKKNNETLETWAIALDEPDGTQATAKVIPKISFDKDGKTFLFVEKGVLSIYVCGIKIQVKIDSTNKIEDILKSVTDALNKNIKLPCVATFHETDVILTMKHKGEYANNLSVEFNLNGETFPKNLILTSENFLSGSGSPDIEKLFMIIKDKRFQSFCIPFSDESNLLNLSEELQKRWDPQLQNDGYAFLGTNLSLEKSINLAAKINSQCISILNTSGFANAPYEISSAICAQCSASCSIDPALPLSNILCEGILPIDSKQLSYQERSTLLDFGFSTLKTQNGQVFTERVITTYKMNESGNSDESYLNAESVFTLSFIREYFRSKFWSKYCRYKLADDGNVIAPGQKILTPKLAKAELLCLFMDLMDMGLVQNYEDFKSKLVVERDKQNRSQMNMILPPTIMSQLFSINALIQFRK